MFVREKRLTTLIEKARAALEKHTRFSSWGATAGETELRANVTWPHDDRRRADLNIFFVHSPASASDMRFSSRDYALGPSS